jgi:hypothetical protein
VAIVQAAAAGLTERDRAVLDLSLRHGLEGEELGAAMGISPGHASVLAGRVRDRVEKSLGALLVARLGRDDCIELQGVLGDWDGSFSPLIRKRVARHVEGCGTCSATKRRVASPAALLSSVPLVAAPATLRSQVMSAYDAHVAVTAPGGGSPASGGAEGPAADPGAGSHRADGPGGEGPGGEGSSTSPQSGSPGGDVEAPSSDPLVTAPGDPVATQGSPPAAAPPAPPVSPMQAPPPAPPIHLKRDGFPRSSSNRGKVAAALVVLILLVGLLGTGLALTSDDGDVQPVATGDEEPAEDTTDVDVERNITVVQDEGPASQGTSTTLPLGPPVDPDGDEPTDDPDPGGGSNPGGGGFVVPPPPPPPPDTTGPSLGFSASPNPIYEVNSLGCPTAAVVTATASDPSGIASMTSSPAGGGGGGSLSIPTGGPHPPNTSVTVTVTAVDGAGNATTRSFSVQVLPVTAPC